MRTKILALEEERNDPAEAIQLVAATEPDAQADEQEVQQLDSESEELEVSLDQAGQAQAISDAVIDTVVPVVPAEGQSVELTAGGSDALATALEHMLNSLGMQPTQSHALVAMEGLSIEQRRERLSVSMEGIGSALKKVAQAIWRVLQKIADWLVRLYHRMVLSVKRLRTRLDAAKRAASEVSKNSGGHEIKNRELRNFFSFRGVDLESHDIAGAVLKNSAGSEKLWEKVRVGAEKAASTAEWMVENPGSQFADHFVANGRNMGADWRAERNKKGNEFAQDLFGGVINNMQFSSERFKDGRAHMVRNQLHMPFGNYVMEFTLVDTHAPQEEGAHPLGSVRSSFGFEPPQHVSEHRQPLMSLFSDEIHKVLDVVARDLHLLEKVQAEAVKIQQKLHTLSKKAFSEAQGQYRGWLRDEVKIESFSMAYNIVNIASRFAHGPLGGLSIYMLKSAHYALRLVEKSITLNAAGPAASMVHNKAAAAGLLV